MGGNGYRPNTFENAAFVTSRPPWTAYRYRVLSVFRTSMSGSSYRIRVLGLARVHRVDPFQTLERLVKLAALQQEFRALREAGQPQGQQDAGQRAQRQEYVPRRVPEHADRVRGLQRDDSPGDHCKQAKDVR